MKVIQEITREQIRKAEAYEALQIDLLDVQHPGEPVRECVLRLVVVIDDFRGTLEVLS